MPVRIYQQSAGRRGYTSCGRRTKSFRGTETKNRYCKDFSQILDEATSALDNTSERIVQLEIEKLQKERGMTIISIAHRLTTLKNCDRIIVMDEGKIIESGRYEELLRQEGVFRDMYQGKRK